jgi:hypothetical protein
MKPETAELLASYGDLEIRRGLSVRGGTTDAVQAGHLSEVLAAFSEFFWESQNHSDEDREAMCNALRVLQWDQMGLDVVAY